MPSRLHEPKQQPPQIDNKTSDKIDALLHEIRELKNNPAQTKEEKKTILKFFPVFIDKIKKIVEQVPYNRTVERVRDRVEQVPYNQSIERVRDRVEQVPYNQSVERVREQVEQVPYNQTVERVRDRVEQVPHNMVYDRVQKRYIVKREYQPMPPRGL